MYGIIRKKRNGDALSRAEIFQVIQDYVAGKVPDYQVSALLMAIYFRGMSPRETSDFTQAMVESGETVDLSALPGVTVDKHSTGGVGDKTTLVLGPLMAAAGLTVAKMSGRGLGHTGGTLDKLESIPGLRTDLSAGEMLSQVRKTGIAVVAQSGALVPADGLLYALRDVTATVDSLPLIASSIMSKKLAAGAHAIVLDVKTGSGAFMSRTDDAFALAQAMVEIGEAGGRSVTALVTSMNQPLGNTIGNALEVREAIATLKGDGPSDLLELCLALGAELLAMTGGEDRATARARLKSYIASGAGLAKLRSLIEAQGGAGTVVDSPDEVLPRSAHSREMRTPTSGYITGLNALTIGEAARSLGAGRHKKGDSIDAGAGIVLHEKIGARLASGQAWATIFAQSDALLDNGESVLTPALSIGSQQEPPLPLIYGSVDQHGHHTRYVG